VQQRWPIDEAPSSPSDVMSWPITNVSGTPSGMRIATEKMPWNEDTVSIGVFINAGSRFETAENNGSAHFLEHLAFKGTQKRTREALEKEIENMGGHLNAYTSREQTVYYAQVLKEDAEQAVDILSDILTNSTLDPASIDRERAVILQEMENVYSESKEELIFDHLHENCFQDCGLGRTILGPVENIKRITRDDLIEYMNTYYTADQMVVVGAGAIDDHNKFTELVKDKFYKVPEKNRDRPRFEPSNFRGCEYDERWDDMEYVYVAYAYPTCAWDHYDSYPLMFIQQLIGQWDKKWIGGKFHVNPFVRWAYSDPSRPIAENFMAFNTPYTDMGLFGIYGQTHPYDLKYFMEATRREMNRIGYDLNEAMVEDTRERLKSTMMLSLGNTTQVMEEIGRQLLVHGRRIHPSEAFARVNDVDVNAIKYAAHRYLIDRDHAVAAVGCTMEMPFYTLFRMWAQHAY